MQKLCESMKLGANGLAGRKVFHFAIWFCLPGARVTENAKMKTHTHTASLTHYQVLHFHFIHTQEQPKSLYKYV